ncbi:GNAT family N-acetyltransferase [Paenibacillus popilliae]|uniref:N-acetyltransferase n=1 Tax=Paenibacillus popilliae TaxID=78057 RepID=A0ABY3AU18_PAEPP|nr:GNAT family protein [Paenibacillus sp. SDF0028]TQR46140.1 N-acetyltransferase [Paenibacillus sp. SDF0028]
MNISYWKGKRIRLRTPVADDIVIFDSLDDSILQNMDSIAFPRTQAQMEEWIEQISQGASENSHDFYWIAEDANKGDVVGTMEIDGTDPKNGTFDYAISVFPAYRGKGYASDMILTVLKHYFFELRYQKATVCIYSFNEASMNLHRKLGFIQEGRLRSMIYTNGKYHDEVYFGMTKEEFEALYMR